jgi:hypothetical protein
MEPISALLLPLAIWSGTARVDVMIREPQGEHPYITDFELEYSEGAPVSVTGPSGGVSHRVPLIPKRVAIDVRHEVRHVDGRSICTGGGQELVDHPPPGALSSPAATYQLVLPRAIGAFACGSKRNAGDRWVVVGTGLFPVQGDVDAADTETRRLDSGGSRMRGEYRFSDQAQGRPVRHDYHVTWELTRHEEPVTPPRTPSR